MSSTPRRTLAAALIALALAAPVAMSAPASATPDKSAAAAPPHSKQLIRAISVKDAQLGRLATAKRTTRLADDVETVLVANISADRTALATVRAEIEAAGSTLDVRAVRRELRDFRVVNYVLAGSVLRKAERLEDELSTDPAAAAHLDEAVAAALALTASSSKADVRDARGHLRLAQQSHDDSDAGEDGDEDPEDERSSALGR